MDALKENGMEELARLRNYYNVMNAWIVFNKDVDHDGFISYIKSYSILGADGTVLHEKTYTVSVDRYFAHDAAHGELENLKNEAMKR